MVIFGIGIFVFFLNTKIKWKPPLDPVKSTKKLRVTKKASAVFPTAIWGLVAYGFYTYLGDGLKAIPTFTTKLIATSFFIYGMGAIIGNLAIPSISKKISNKTIRIFSFTGMSICLAFISLKSANSVLILEVGLFSLVAYLFFSAQQSILVNSFPQYTASLMAYNNTALYVGIFFGSALGGKIVLSFGSFGLAVVVGIVAGLTGIVLLLKPLILNIPKNKILLK